MKKSEKISAVADLTAKIQQAKSVILVNYKGLTVAQMGQLRSMVKKANGELIVIKNTLLNLAINQAKPGIKEDQISEPTAIVLSYQDEVAALKAITDFSKANSLPTLKSGILESQRLTKEEVEQLSRLPGKPALIAQLLQVLQSSPIRFVSVLQANQTKLLYILQNLKGAAQS